MRNSDLVPAGKLAQCYGVKVVCYGPPGSGKTPIVNTAPRPVLLAVEPGLRSMAGSNVPTYMARSVPEVDGFFQWLFSSNEAKAYDTVCIDSGTQMAENHLKWSAGKRKHGMQAYGDMATWTMEHMDALYDMQQKHVYIIAKQTMQDIDGVTTRLPKFPGKDLDTKIPHLFDEILHLGLHNVPEANGEVKAFRCTETYGLATRDRSGRLNDYEQPNLSNIFAKIMKT